MELDRTGGVALNRIRRDVTGGDSILRDRRDLVEEVGV